MKKVCFFYKKEPQEPQEPLEPLESLEPLENEGRGLDKNTISG